MMMSILISGPHQLGIDTDVHLRSLVDDKTLCSEGIDAYYGYKREPFTLRGLFRVAGWLLRVRTV
jgi:hypothetical protein